MNEEKKAFIHAMIAVQSTLKRLEPKKKADIKARSGVSFKFKYAPSHDVWDHLKKAISENGFAVVQAPCVVDGRPAIRTKAMHVDGHEEVAEMLLADSGDNRAMAASTTTARRLSLAALFCVQITDEPDATEADDNSSRGSSAWVERERMLRESLAAIAATTTAEALRSWYDSHKAEIAQCDPDTVADIKAAISTRNTQLTQGDASGGSSGPPKKQEKPTKERAAAPSAKSKSTTPPTTNTPAVTGAQEPQGQPEPAESETGPTPEDDPWGGMFDGK